MGGRFPGTVGLFQGIGFVLGWISFNSRPFTYKGACHFLSGYFLLGAREMSFLGVLKSGVTLEEALSLRHLGVVDWGKANL